MISRQQGIAFTEDPSCAVAKASAKKSMPQLESQAGDQRFPSLRSAKITSRRERRCINGSTTGKTRKAPAFARGIR
jgi:hypothetical protein